MTATRPQNSPSITDFKLSGIAENPLSASFLKLVDPALEKLLGLDKMKKVYRESLQGLPDADFVKEAIKTINAKIRIRSKELKLIPTTGPVILIANHPYGGLDGIILYDMLKKVRPDFKIMASKMLKLFPELQEHFLFVDVFSEKSVSNINPLKKACRHLRENGLLAVFPAGEVSCYQLTKKKVTDKEWNDSVARLARKSGAQIVPVHFSGGNSLSFHMAGFVHPLLRTVLLPRQMMKKNRKIRLRVGEPLKSKTIKQFNSADELCRFLRLKTYLLSEKPADLVKQRSKKKRNNRFHELVGQPVSTELILADIEALSPENHLLDFKGYSVYRASIQQLPNAILEIGRLRAE